MLYLYLQDAPLKHNLNGGSVIRTLIWIIYGPFLTDFLFQVKWKNSTSKLFTDTTHVIYS